MQFNPGGDAICVTEDKHVYYCQKVGTTYQCDLQVARTASDIPASVQDALDDAIQESQDNTKVPNTDLLKDDSLLNDDNDTDGNDDRKVPKDLGGLNDDGLTIKPYDKP